MRPLSLRTHLLLLVGGAITACIVLALSGLAGSRYLAGEVSQLLVTQKMIRQQTEADMMHDAIRGDVLSALYRLSRGESDKLAAIRDDAKAHGDSFRQLLAANRELAGNSPLGSEIDKVLPLVQRYIDSAGRITGQAGGQMELALQALPGFEADFKTLEDGMEALTDSIEAQSSHSESGVTDAVNRQAMLSLLLGGIAAVLLLAYALYLIRILLLPLQRLTHTANRVSQSGDLSLRVDERAGLELSQAIRAFNGMLQSQQALVSGLREVSNSLQHSASSIGGLTRRLHHDAETQCAAAERISEAISQMSTSVGTVSDSTHHALQRTLHAGQQASDSSRTVTLAADAILAASESVQQVSGVIHSLDNRARDVSQVVNTISGIAEQTNMLALNAAIEAARAGESGRGFAVVADEVRALAVRTSTATVEIQQIVTGIQESARQAVEAMQRSIQQVAQSSQQAQMAGSAIEDIQSGARDSAETMQRIHAELQQQANSSHTIASDADQVSTMARDSLGSAREVAEETGQLEALAGKLDQSLRGFSV
ncbi:methyl-accepting chemotaxis protein [Vogesella amnigena]|uniref:Methyl-accepting chemotaxis protein n=1 Tax=Vogesella amnigena TaxID=1507449 RepID=A0ABV7TQ55_9NEIS